MNLDDIAKPEHKCTKENPTCFIRFNEGCEARFNKDKLGFCTRKKGHLGKHIGCSHWGAGLADTHGDAWYETAKHNLQVQE